MSEDVSRATDNSNRNIAAQIEQKRSGNRKNVHHGGTLCSHCYAAPPLPYHRYCGSCRSQYEAARRRAEREELRRLRAAHGEGQS